MRDSEARLRTLIDNLPDLIYFKDMESRFLAANMATARTMGAAAPEELIGKTDADFYPPELANRYLADEQKALQSGRPLLSYEEPVVDPAGNRRWILSSKIPLHDAEGRVVGLVGIGRDITERKQAEERIRQIINTIPDGVLLLNKEHQIVFANPTAHAYLGRLTDAAVGKTLTRLGDRPLSSFLKPKPPDVAWPEIVLEEPRQIFTVGAQAVTANRQVDGWVVVLSDVTQERLRQEELQAQERLATVGRLAAGIAHDFNNLLAPTLLYAEMVQDHLTPNSRDWANVERIIAAATRGKELIARILAFGRQKPETARSPIQIQPIVEDVLALLRASLPAAIEIRQKLDDRAGPVMADATQIHQVIMNLCTNACYAMQPHGGLLEIGLETIFVDKDLAALHSNLQAGRYLRLTVRDTGHGMDRATLTRIFDPFFTTKPTGEGAGLGLSVVHGIVTNHNGAVTVESEPGKGATFHVYLPALEKEERV